ncbi:aspartate/glutamate racemase family protein [Miniphocaeibacter halophilus]|uniref:Aspartate/glutamate racemase family protein n=1 Tax=Miniphocaeibacter halophilus TaxID=2931922 RepID=A0AC61MVF9_9FIRM|nr:amino acid racemase [Miniphocaeibacter halophilus]QQK07856.1 aspartate/glutamate racemase family protein [Miniphocaeibacter halophilus]
MKDIKKLGIIGGMGPLATSLFMKRIVEKTQAHKDQDHINTIVSNHATLPDRTEVIKNNKPEEFLSKIDEDIKLMEFAKVDNIAIPCNTSHFYFDEIQKMTNINIINMVDETIKYIKNNTKFNKIAVLGTYGTMGCRVYDKYALLNGLEVYSLNEMEEKISVDSIYDVKEKMILKSEKFNELLRKLSKENVISILACTELSCLDLPIDLENYYIDAMEVLVEKSIEYSGGKVKS